MFIEKGLIPGPEEKEAQFSARTKALNQFYSYPPEEIDRFLTDGDWRGARETTESLFGFSSDWIVAYYSNARLSFFQGAATWISTRNDLRIPVIQLKEQFESGSLHKLYRREEVLAHEAVHAARMQFDEPIFEEFFAYKTSPHWWRRVFGPIFQRPWEAYLFIILLLIPLGMEVARFFYPEIGPFFVYVPFIFFGLLLVRLSVLHLTLAVALKRLVPYLKSSHKRWAAGLCLRDREIFKIAFLPRKKLEKFLKKDHSFRWKLLRDCYFKK
ncbi:MAG: hypothetical protein JSS30_00765 [Verrucomicrobia bacterium]|nr:hypothetical protein [Verrucomicrobiota bacterium]